METLITVEVQVGELRHDGGKPAKVQYFRVATTGLDAAVPSSRRPAGLPDLTWVAGQRFDVERRYGDAELLRELLCLQCRGVVLPPLPPKKGRSPPEKKDQLELFLQSLVEYCPAEVREEPFVLRFLVEEPGVFRRRTVLAMQQAKAERLEADRPALRRRVLDAFSRTASLVPLLTPQPPPPQDRAATPWGEIAAAAAGTRGTLQRAAEALAAYVASVTAMLAAAGRCAAVAESWAPSPSAEGPAPVEHGPLSLSEVQAALDQSIRCALCAVEYAAQRGPRMWAVTGTGWCRESGCAGASSPRPMGWTPSCRRQTSPMLARGGTGQDAPPAAPGAVRSDGDSSGGGRAGPRAASATLAHGGGGQPPGGRLRPKQAEEQEPTTGWLEQIPT
eukprot:gene12672-biopygen9314